MSEAALKVGRGKSENEPRSYFSTYQLAVYLWRLLRISIRMCIVDKGGILSPAFTDRLSVLLPSFQQSALETSCWRSHFVHISLLPQHKLGSPTAEFFEHRLYKPSCIP